MRIKVVENPNITFEGAGLLLDEFLPLVVLNKQKFEELNKGIETPSSEQGLKVASGINIQDDKDNYTYSIESSEDEITIPLLVKQGSEDTILDDDGIISITSSEKIPEINLTKNQFTTKYGEEVEFKIKRDNPAFEKEFEIKIVAEDNVDDDYYFDGELKDVLCGGIKIKFKKKEVKFETLRIKVLDCRSNEPVVNARVKKVVLNGKHSIEHEFNSQEFNKNMSAIDAESKIMQSQQALEGLGFDTNGPGNNYGDNGRRAYNDYWKSRFPELIDAGIVEEVTEGNPTDEMLDYIIADYNGSYSTDTNGYINLQIPKELLSNGTTLDISFNSAYILNDESSYARSQKYSIKTGTDKFNQFNGNDINQDELKIKVYKLKEIFTCVESSSKYGPYYLGEYPLKSYDSWNELIESNKISNSDKELLIAMSDNEGRFDSIQSYDSETLSVGIIQKTVNSIGKGEFPIQVEEFKIEYPDKYVEYFENAGWTIQNGKMYFKSILSDYKDAKTGAELKSFIRTNFNDLTYRKKIGCEPLENLLKAVESKEFKAKQIADFISRLLKVLKFKPQGYSNKLSSYLKSNLGKATVLDHHVNRPAHVKIYFGEALNLFFKQKDREVNDYNKDKGKDKHRSKIPREPSSWGENHITYEKQILEIYGPLRGEALGDIPKRKAMTKAKERYKHLKDNL